MRPTSMVSQLISIGGAAMSVQSGGPMESGSVSTTKETGIARRRVGKLSLVAGSVKRSSERNEIFLCDMFTDRLEVINGI